MPFCFHWLYRQLLEYSVVKILNANNSALRKLGQVRNHLQQLGEGVRLFLGISGVNGCIPNHGT
jgi:hypothetical protein